MTTHPKPIGPHDLAGQPAGPVERADHDVAYWERVSDAIIYVLRDKGLMTDAAELRVGIETLGEDAYNRLSYYERWAASTAKAMVARGVITEAELDDEVARQMAERGLTE